MNAHWRFYECSRGMVEILQELKVCVDLCSHLDEAFDEVLGGHSS